jgi:hypothetical protein
MYTVGGRSNWIIYNANFSVLYFVLLIVSYMKLYQGIPGKGWIKGLTFGISIGLIKAIPEAFNQFKIFNYPTELIIVQLVIALLGLLIFGVLLWVFFNKFKVIVIE